MWPFRKLTCVFYGMQQTRQAQPADPKRSVDGSTGLPPTTSWGKPGQTCVGSGGIPSPEAEYVAVTSTRTWSKKDRMELDPQEHWWVKWKANTGTVVKFGLWVAQGINHGWVCCWHQLLELHGCIGCSRGCRLSDRLRRSRCQHHKPNHDQSWSYHDTKNVGP